MSWVYLDNNCASSSKSSCGIASCYTEREWKVAGTKDANNAK
jgi:hypothetical protein